MYLLISYTDYSTNLSIAFGIFFSVYPVLFFNTDVAGSTSAASWFWVGWCFAPVTCFNQSRQEVAQWILTMDDTHRSLAVTLGALPARLTSCLHFDNRYDSNCCIVCLLFKVVVSGIVVLVYIYFNRVTVGCLYPERWAAHRLLCVQSYPWPLLVGPLCLLSHNVFRLHAYNSVSF